MPFLSTTQLIIILWLLAAAAPAATVLISGSMMPWSAPAAASETRTATTRAVTSAKHAIIQEKAVVPGADIFCETSTAALGSEQRPLGISLGLLHTAVQRHRPKTP
jgi:hypothetical protein